RPRLDGHASAAPGSGVRAGPTRLARGHRAVRVSRPAGDRLSPEGTVMATPTARTATELGVPAVRPSDETKPLPLQMAPKRRGKPPRHFADLTPQERVASVVEMGEKPFRAKQLAAHYFTHFTSDPAEMTDLPKATRDALATTMFPPLIRPTRRMEADGGTTVKTLWHLFDEAKVESVLMRYPNRTTLCVSSQ